MPKDEAPKTNKATSEAARLLGKRSAQARAEAWGKKNFVQKMREWGKLGGRPKGSGKKQPKKGGK